MIGLLIMILVLYGIAAYNYYKYLYHKKYDNDIMINDVIDIEMDMISTNNEWVVI